MGYSASASSSQSATSGNKTSIGPTTFGGIAFGSQGNGSSSSYWPWVIAGVAALAAGFFFWRSA